VPSGLPTLIRDTPEETTISKGCKKLDKLNAVPNYFQDLAEPPRHLEVHKDDEHIRHRY
jgi:hypothetical protein